MSVSKSAVVLTAALLMAAGCTSTGSNAAAPAPAPSTPSATSETGSAPSTPVSSPATTKAASGQGAGTTRCRSSDLKIVWKVDPGGGAAGSQGSYLIFTNTSAGTCTLYGFPGVSFVAGDQGTQVGDAFRRNEGPKKTVSVAPGKTAYSQLVLVNASVYDKADCKPVSARGFRVYPPEETASVFVSQSQTACSAKGKGVGVVWPIVAGSPAT